MAWSDLAEWMKPGNVDVNKMEDAMKREVVIFVLLIIGLVTLGGCVALQAPESASVSS